MIIITFLCEITHITLHFYYKLAKWCIMSHHAFVIRSFLFDIKHRPLAQRLSSGEEFDTEE